MKREILIHTILCIAALIPMIARAQNNQTSTRSTLKIAIPVREFSEFVVIQRNSMTGENNYTGFAIEVFQEVMKNALPTSIPYQFAPFQKPDGTMNGSFDDMLQAVSNKDYDGAVGEISILFYRTTMVEFTMPFLESSITMLVPRKQEQTSNDAGVSMTGITYAIVIITYVLGFMAFIVAASYGVVICIRRAIRAQRPGNNDNETNRAMRSLIQTRVMTITFFILLLTLNACYIVNQTSSNSPQRGNDTIKNLTQLIRKGSNVGYREGSFVRNLLIVKGFSESKLISLKNEQEMVDKLSKGTSQGGVDAIVANGPHLKLLQAKYCDKFTMVPTTNLQATGFGFAFGRGSNLTKDVSNGILKIVDNGKLGKIQDRTIGNLETCEDDSSDNDVGSSFLSHDHKWILIVGVILVGLLIIVSIAFLF